MIEPKPGDRVRVTYEAEYGRVASRTVREPRHYVHLDGGSRYQATVPANATIEVIAPADDPSKDPIGTVRENTGCFKGVHVRVRRDGEGAWKCIGKDDRSFDVSNDSSTFGPIIGAVPGTPAAEVREGS